MLLGLLLPTLGFAFTPIQLTAGWNLVGNSDATPIEVAARFNGANISTVWTWNKVASKWAFYTPSMSAAQLANYAQTQGYEVLSSIAPKDGFWVNANAATLLADPLMPASAQDAAALLAPGDLAQGWSLLASADKQTPMQLNQTFIGGLSASGKAIVTAWAWDASQANWKFYAPSLQAQGGTVLADYVASKSYLPFSNPLAPTEGFWLNIGTGSDLSGNMPQLKPFASPTALERFLKDAITRTAASNFGYRYLDTAIAMPTATTSTNTGAASGGAASANFSTTNLQEVGVDEADRLKSDGKYLYVLGQSGNPSGSSLQILALADSPPAQASSVAKLALDSQRVYSQSYLATNRPNAQADVLVALSESKLNYYPVLGLPPGVPTIMPALDARNWFAPQDWRQGQVELLWVNVSNRTQPQAGTRLAVDGYLVASRRIGETVYLVTRFSPSMPYIAATTDLTKQTAAEQAALQQTTLADLLPKWYVNGVDQGALISAATCYQAPGMDTRQTPDLMVVAAIDLGNPSAMPRAQCLTGNSETAYVSTEALYIATTRYNYTTQIDPTAQTGSAISSAMIAFYPPDYATDVHKFALTSAGPQYRGSGSVAGHLGWEQDKKSFRMGEFQGDLRMATSVGESWGNSTSHRLSVLRESAGALALIGQIPNAQRPAPLGKPGEKIYAARFVGKRAYLVTFRLTDPLYVLDLADPVDPKIAGELQIPGYSDYLHPIGEDLLLGIGKDALSDTVSTWGDGRGAWYQGVKVALFNVADASNPKEVSSLVIGKRGTQSAALLDHHAFTYMPVTGNGTELARFALPIERHATLPKYNYLTADDPRNYFDWSDSGLYLFSVSPTALSQQGELRVEQRSATVSYPSSSGAQDRALLRGDEVHYLHGQEVWSAPWGIGTPALKAN
jgi:uncharacterized secreted protein with C-terminal beta-propeller domain